MTFEELLALLMSPPEEGVPETIYDDLRSSYTSMADGSAAKVADQDAIIQGLNAEISRLKAANYDLMVRQSAPPEGQNEGNDSDDDTEPGGIDDLFGKDED